jgi:hypothetical protein
MSSEAEKWRGRAEMARRLSTTLPAPDAQTLEEYAEQCERTATALSCARPWFAADTDLPLSPLFGG